MTTQLTPDQLARLSEIPDPTTRQRFTAFYQLPQDLQTLMFSEQTSGSVWQIAKEKYNLADKDVSVVARIIGLIFLGELPIKNFIVELKNMLGVDTIKAQQIAQDINVAIFQPVRESLMRVHGIERGPTPNRTQIHTEINTTQQRREEVLNKIRPPQPPPLRPLPTQSYGTARQGSAGQAIARPTSYLKPRNIVNLRNVKRKNKYNGFFST
ncbi:MAG: hypothetical protein HY452_01830 [Parcubacteria group bacterium]|uniref:Uncharacterized protein n=1 Tax=Candidatus Sungiibacteriota bacterium TaxID=2750080 RepID=A0A9D6HQX2_9BACT|nr:hypothetical protein [Candidatus Sungbacteria bacterium]MBI4118979.1 hypothetical protein [Parcubacteria group bacterium]